MRQPKVERKCDACGSLTKRTIGAQSRIKYWVCVNPHCGLRKPA